MKTVVYPTSPGIGDLIWHLPFIRAIAAGSEGGTVTVVARSSTLAREWLSPDPAVAEVVYHHRRARAREQRVLEGAEAAPSDTPLAAELRRRRFDRAFLFSARVKPAFTLWRAGIPLRAGYGHTLAQRLWLNAPPFTRPYRGPLAPRLYFDAVAFARAQGFSDEATQAPPRLHVPPEVMDRFRGSLAELGSAGVVAFSIGASGERKNWGPERFASLGRELASRGFGVLALGGPAEAELADAIEGRMAEEAPNLASSLRCVVSRSVLESAALLGQCTFLVGNDTGMLNVAAAMGVPVLGLFGATTPLTHDPSIEAVRGDGMERITVEGVLEKLARLGWA